MVQRADSDGLQRAGQLNMRNAGVVREGVFADGRDALVHIDRDERLDAVEGLQRAFTDRAVADHVRVAVGIHDDPRLADLARVGDAFEDGRGAERAVAVRNDVDVGRGGLHLHDVLDVLRSVQRLRVDLVERAGQEHGFQAAAVRQRADLQSADTLWDPDALDGRAAVEGERADSVHLHRRFDGLEAGAVVEGVGTDHIHVFGQLYGAAQVGAVVEGAAADIVQVFGHAHRRHTGVSVGGVDAGLAGGTGRLERRQRDAAVEGVVADALQAGGQRDALQRAAALEAFVAQLRDARGDVDFRQAGVPEGAFAQISQAGGQIDILQRSAAAERVIIDVGDGVRQVYRRQRSAPVERVLTHAFGACGHEHLVQRSAAAEQVVRYEVQIRQHRALEVAHAFEAGHADVLHAVREDDLRDARAAGERAVADLHHAAGHVEHAAGGRDAYVQHLHVRVVQRAVLQDEHIVVL